MLANIREKIDFTNAVNYFFITYITLLFWLLHTNQSSSQTAATLFLLFAPFAVLFAKGTEIIKHRSLMITISLVFLFVIYNFLVLTQHKFSQLSLSSYRALFFWLLFPIATILIWKAKPSRQWIFILFACAAIFSLSPVIRDYMNGRVRGASSGHPIFWGNIALCSGVIAFALRKSIAERRWPTYLGYIALTCGLTASFWSQTRGGWISIPISLLILVSLKSIGKVQAGGIILLLVVAIFSFDTVENRIANTIQKFNIFNAEVKLDGSTQVRLDMFQASFEIFTENPLFGNGFASYKTNSQELVKQGKGPGWVSHFEQPHNEYLNTLVTSGITGLAILLAILTSILYLLFKLPQQSSYKVAGYLLVSQFLIFSMSEIFFSTKLTIIYFCIAATLIIYAGLKEDEYA